MGSESGRRVLVVDDDGSIRLLCRVNLELDGWTVYDAATLAGARAHLAEGGIAVVLLDVHVGAESGASFVAELRRDHPGVRVALLTGSVGETTVRCAADAVIEKPFTIDQLTGTVERLAAG